MSEHWPAWLSPPGLERIAFALALASLLPTVAAWALFRSSAAKACRLTPPRTGPRAALPSVALFLGVAAAIPLTMLLMIRAVTAGIDLLYPTPPVASALGFGLGRTGLGAWSILCAAVATGLAVTRDARLGTCLFGCALGTLSWAALREPIVEQATRGALSRTPAVALWTLGCSGLCVGAACLLAVVERRRRWQCVGGRADELANAPAIPAGLRIAVAVVCLTVALSACHQLIAPDPVRALGFRRTAFMMAISSAAAGLAGWHLLQRAWSPLLLDAVMSLVPPAFAGASLMFLSDEPAAMQWRFPRMFTAMLFGLGAATAWLTFLSLVWRDQIGPEGPWSTDGRLSRVLPRFAFMNGALALIVAAVLAMWPRLSGVSAPDDSIGQMAAGVAGNLWLALSLMWCARRLRRPTFHALALLAMLMTAGFVIVRVMPYSSHAM